MRRGFTIYIPPSTYSESVQCLLVSNCISLMLCQSHGKIMIARKILFGTHIKIPVRCMCQHGIDSLFRRNPYRAGRQSRNPISIIWRFYGQMNIQYAFQRKIPVGKFYRRVCLQRHKTHKYPVKTKPGESLS